MAQLYARSDGSIICFAPSLTQLPTTPIPPPSYAALLDFDEATNAATVADIQANWFDYSLPLVAGSPQLQKKGVPVTIAGPTALYSLQWAVLTGVSDAALKAAIVALWNGTATTQQQQRALAYCLLKLKQAGLI